jgi:hypothetical protein
MDSAYLPGWAGAFPSDAKCQRKEEAQEKRKVRQVATTGYEHSIGLADWIPREPKSELRAE